MPLTSKGNEIMAAMKKQYGEKKGEEVFYASKNAGKISGVDSDEEIAADSDNPIDLNIPDYSRVHGALDSMAEQISSLGERAAGVLRTLARADAKAGLENTPEFQAYKRKWEAQVKATEEYNAAAKAYSAGKMDYKEWRRILEGSIQRDKEFDRVSKEYRAWRRKNGYD